MGKRARASKPSFANLAKLLELPAPPAEAKRPLESSFRKAAEALKLLETPVPAPLDLVETYELLRLRDAVTAPKKYATEREELDALRAVLQRELEAVRARTQEQTWYVSDPIAELTWRRPLAEVKAKAEEAKAKAEEAEAQRKREAEEKAREEKARRKREHEEEQRTYARQKREAERVGHVTLTEAERRWQEVLRQDWAEHGSPESPEEALIWSVPGDCGRKHMSDSAACACANVRREEAEARQAMTSPPTSSSPARQAPPRFASTPTRQEPPKPVPPASTTPARAVPPRSTSTSARPALPKPAPPAPPPLPREQPVPARAREQVVPGLGTRVPVSSPPPREHPVPARGTPPPARSALGPSASSRPTPGAVPPPPPPRPSPVASSTPARPVREPMPGSARPTYLRLVSSPPPPVASSPLAERILVVVQAGHYMSVNGIVKALAATGEGARRQDVYAEVGAMLTDGRLTKINDVIRPGPASGTSS